MTQDFINKVEESFVTLSKKNGKFGIYDELVKETWENDPEGEMVIETVYKILDLFNNSNEEQQTILFNSEISEIINKINVN